MYGHAHLLTSPRCEVPLCDRPRQAVLDDGREVCAAHALENERTPA